MLGDLVLMISGILLGLLDGVRVIVLRGGDLGVILRQLNVLITLIIGLFVWGSRILYMPVKSEVLVMRVVMTAAVERRFFGSLLLEV